MRHEKGNQTKEYYQKIYSKIWPRQVKRYGLSSDTKRNISILLGCRPRKAFEVGIGTGWPYAAALMTKGKAEVSGCDISERLIRQVREHYPQMHVYSGELKDSGEKYDLIYCIRVSWCMPDFYERLQQMLTMLDNSEKDANLVFDVLDKRCLRYPARILANLYKPAPVQSYFYSSKKINSILDKSDDITYKVYNEYPPDKNRGRILNLLLRQPKCLYIVCKTSRGG